MRYMPINSGSVLHGIWHDLRLRELKDKLEEMHVMYELSHKKGASMSNKKFVSFLDLTLSRNELGLVVVAGLPTGDSTLIVVPPIGSVQTDKIGFNDMSIDERCALWALVYGQSYNERPTFKPTSEPSHGGIPVKSPKSDKVVIKFLRDSVPAVSPQLAELLSLAGMTQRSAEAEDNEDTDTNQERGEAEMTTMNREISARLKEVGKKLAEKPEGMEQAKWELQLYDEMVKDIDASALAFMRDLRNDSVHGKARDFGTVLSVKKNDNGGIDVEFDQGSVTPAQNVSETKDPELLAKLANLAEQLVELLPKADTPKGKLAQRVNALLETMHALDASLATTYNRNQPTPTSEEAMKASTDEYAGSHSTAGENNLYPGHDFESLLPWFAAAYTNDRTDWPTVTEHVINRTRDIFGTPNLDIYSYGRLGGCIALKRDGYATFRELHELREALTYQDVFKGISVINDDTVRTIWFMDMMTEFSHLPPSAEPFGPELRVPPYHPLMRQKFGDALVNAIYGQPPIEAFDPKNLGMRTRGMLMTANTNLNGRYTVDKHFSCRLKKAEK